MAYFNPYQPMGYGGPYGYPSGGPQSAAGGPQAFMGQVTRVNGKGGAEAFRMAPNSSVLLMDEHDPIVWLKTTDGDAVFGCPVSARAGGRRQQPGRSREEIGGDAQWQTR